MTRTEHATFITIVFFGLLVSAWGLWYDLQASSPDRMRQKYDAIITAKCKGDGGMPVHSAWSGGLIDCVMPSKERRQ